MADIVIKSSEEVASELISDILALDNLEQHLARRKVSEHPLDKEMRRSFLEQRKSFLRKIYPSLMQIDMESEEFQMVLSQMLPEEKHNYLRERLLGFYRNLEKLVSA